MQTQNVRSRSLSANKASGLQAENSRTICVYDFRHEGGRVPTKKQLETRGLDINEFLQLLRKEFKCHPRERFVLETTDRVHLDFDEFKELKNGSTLYMLQHEHQDLPIATEEIITYTPHFHTLTESGTYEYHASEGHNSLPYTLAELIDNSLSATVDNKSERLIEIQMIVDESIGKPALIVVDNGCGMTSKKLNNWAVFKLSKFTRDDSTCLSHYEGCVRPDPVPRSLNSDLSYFGCGGKQAIFFIGDSVRMITKTKSSPDVHELVLSKADFKSKESNKEDIFSGTIRNRKPGDSSHITNTDEKFLHSLIADESGKESFTAVVITGLKSDNITFIKDKFNVLTRQLSHVYHYYLNGVNGKNLNSPASTYSNSNIEIQIMMRERPPRLPRQINLRDIKDDMQTLYITSASDTFEFKAEIAKPVGIVEGIIRYHPFLYDKETYPEDPYATQDPASDDEDFGKDSGALTRARGKRPIFECFWNGRLIPSTTVSEFDWCAYPGKGASVPAECYSRISGVLFTDDIFKVTQNKLTFMDLELQIKNKDTIFTTASTGVGQKTFKRGNIQREFTQWLVTCHENFDKQVMFFNYKETIKRTDLPTKKWQEPWASFSAIEWDGKIYKAGQLVKSLKTQPIVYGTVNRFLLYGNHDSDTFATGGHVEIFREPKDLYNMPKAFLISKIDQAATDEIIKKNIESDNSKLPEKLEVEWPEGKQWPADASRPAGSSLGPLKVKILNSKGDSISAMPKVGQGQGPKLSVRLTVTHLGSSKKTQEESRVAHYSAKFSYWFRKYENLTKMGKYKVTLEAILNESSTSMSRQKPLPSCVLHFTIIAGEPDSFVLKNFFPNLRVGVPFQIPLQIKDAYGHLIESPPQLKPLLKCSGLELTYLSVEIGTNFTISGVKAKGKVQNYQQSKMYDLKVTLAGLKNDTQTIKITLLPGSPHSLQVTPKENPVRIENGKEVKFNIEVHDEAGNITANSKQDVRCHIQGFQPITIECSKTGAGQFIKPIDLKIIKGEPKTLKVNFESIISGNILMVKKELIVLPSTRVVKMELCCKGDDIMLFKNDDKIEWPAGGVLGNLYYKLYDEGGREVVLNAEIASRIKVTWTNDDNLKDLVKGKLPDVQVPKKVSDMHFYQVNYQNQNVSNSFIIIPHPDEPKQLKATLSQNVVKLGETLSENIILELVDKFDNLTKTLTPPCTTSMMVEADGLDKAKIAFVWQEETSSVAVKGVCFKSGALGSREICFTYCDYVARIIIKVIAGIPAELKLVSEPAQPLQVLNNQGVSTPFVVQLCDKWGNPSPDKRVVVELKSSPQGLKVFTTVASQPVDGEGKASFIVSRLNGLKGYYQLEFKGSFNKTPISGPSVNLTVIPDPTKPVSLTVQYDGTEKLLAGGVFPVITVTVASDEGSPISNLNPANVSMLLWKGTPTRNLPPQKVTEMKCSKPLQNDRNDCFYFRDKKIPEQVGKYIIQFSLQVGKDDVLSSPQMPVNVVANQPVRLSPECPISSPVVSHSKDISHRILVKNMNLCIVDMHGNPAGQNMDGRVSVSIVCQKGGGGKSIPLFEGKLSRFQINLTDGMAHIDRLAIVENSPGENGSIYALLFQAEIKGMLTHLVPFELSFHFYNDADNQQKLSEMTRKKDELSKEIQTYKELCDISQGLLQLLTNKHHDASYKETELRRKLHSRNITISQPVSSINIDTMIQMKTVEAEQISTIPRRVCRDLDPFKGQPDVLGKVSHLATVHDDAAAWVISWQIGGMMNCVVTRTTEAAQKIHRDTHGRQMVMALDSVFVSHDNRPLPHMRNGQRIFDPPGNPVRARSLLIYSEDWDNCDIVFKNLLGETIVIDDLNSANIYRRAVVQKRIPCPTLLTREGERVSSKGIFGGSQNKAPPMSSIKLFGAPLPQEYNMLTEEKKLLVEYRELVGKLEEAKAEKDDHYMNMSSTENSAKKQEMLEKQEQLREIERELASMQAKPIRRQLENDAGSSGISAKRPKI